MTLQEHDTATGPQVPHATKGIQTTESAVVREIEMRIHSKKGIRLTIQKQNKQWYYSEHGVRKCLEKCYIKFVYFQAIT